VSVTANPEVGGGIGPPDGAVLDAGSVRWLPVRPPNRPDMPGRWLITFTVAGRGVYSCEGTQLIVRRGDMVLMFDDSPTSHAVPAGEPWEHAAVLFDPPCHWTVPAAFDRVGPGLYRAPIASEPTRRRTQDAFARVVADVRRRDTARALDRQRYQATDVHPVPVDDPHRRLLLTLVQEILLLAMHNPSDERTVDPRIAVVLEAMGTDPGERHSVESLSEAANLSPSHFAHLFTTQVGMSPMRTLRLIRLQHATRLLQCTGEPIGAVALASGFSSIFDFSRQFRRQNGISPTDYRAQWRS
jgi:AraC family transcriptional regulator of arabinose operon